MRSFIILFCSKEFSFSLSSTLSPFISLSLGWTWDCVISVHCRLMDESKNFTTMYECQFESCERNLLVSKESHSDEKLAISSCCEQFCYQIIVQWINMVSAFAIQKVLILESFCYTKSCFQSHLKSCWGWANSVNGKSQETKT